MSERESARRWVAEHVMGQARKACAAGDRHWHVGGAFEDGYVEEDGFYCRWCGRMVLEGDTTPCPEYPFAAFDLVQLMRRLAEDDYFIEVQIRSWLDTDVFAVMASTPFIPGNIHTEKIAQTDDPFGDLCKWLVQRYNGGDRREDTS